MPLVLTSANLYCDLLYCSCSEYFDSTSLREEYMKNKEYMKIHSECVLKTSGIYRIVYCLIDREQLQQARLLRL